MRPETSLPIRLEDYRVPDYLVETVDLDFALDPRATHVRARTAYRPNPRGVGGAPLILDADELTLVSIALDGRPLEAHEYALSETSLTLATPPRHRFVLDIETKLDPTSNTKLFGLYRSGGTYCTQCEAQGFRRITYFQDRPDVLAVYTTRIEAERDEAPVLLANGNRMLRARSRGARVISRSGTTLRRSPPIFSRSSAGASLACPALFKTRSGRKVELGIYVEPGKEKRAGYAHGRARALDALGRGGVRARIRSRRLQHRRRVGFQHGRDGEQGPQCLQRQICAGQHPRPRPMPITPISRRSSRTNISTTGPATGSPAATGSSSAEGRADGLPRPGIHLRHALAPGEADRGCAHAARPRNSPRTPGPSRIRCGRASITRSTTSTRRPSTRRARKSSAC